MRECRFHMSQYASIDSDCRFNEWVTDEQLKAMTWHETEASKLKAVLDAVYSGWDDDIKRREAERRAKAWEDHKEWEKRFRK